MHSCGWRKPIWKSLHAMWFQLWDFLNRQSSGRSAAARVSEGGMRRAEQGRDKTVKPSSKQSWAKLGPELKLWVIRSKSHPEPEAEQANPRHHSTPWSSQQPSEIQTAQKEWEQQDQPTSRQLQSRPEESFNNVFKSLREAQQLQLRLFSGQTNQTGRRTN